MCKCIFASITLNFVHLEQHISKYSCVTSILLSRSLKKINFNRHNKILKKNMSIERHFTNTMVAKNNIKNISKLFNKTVTQ